MMKLAGTHYAYARRRQSISITETTTRHAFRILIDRGGVHGVGFRIGSAAGAQDILSEVTLGTGEHIVSFIPNAATIHIELNHRGYDTAYVTSCDIFDNSDLKLTTSYNLGSLASLRTEQSGDIVYIGAKGLQQRKLIRRDDYSWSLEYYEPYDGPFLPINITTTTLTPSATTGEISLTANKDLFTAAHVGALFKLDSVAQTTSDSLSGADQFGSSVRVRSIGTERNLQIDISGTWAGTVTLQRSIGEEGSWADVATYTTNQTAVVYNDGLDNDIVFYRLGIKTGNYTSGTAVVALTYSSGSDTGVCRITSVTNATSANAVVLVPLGSTRATEDWYEGRWSDYRGWPSAPLLHEGRLWWFGKDRVIGSMSDDYESFDQDEEGENAPIERIIGSGMVERIYWAMSLERIILGAGGAVLHAKASSQDEILTRTNFSLKRLFKKGCADLPAVEFNEGLAFVDRSGSRVYGMMPNEGGRLTPRDLTLLVPDLCEDGIVAIAVQTQPNLRLHVVLADGSAAVLVLNEAEGVEGWITVTMGDTTQEAIVGVMVLPGDGREDHVYYVVRSGETYVLTKWAQESECRGASMNKQADLFVSSTSSASSITVPTFLNGRTFYIWADGQYRGTAVVAAGAIALGGTYTNASAGLYYRARYKSAKLAYASGMGTALMQKKNLGPLALLLHNTYKDGIKYGTSFDKLRSLSQIVRGEAVAAATVHEHLDTPAMPMPGSWDTDSRLCLQAEAQRPATVLAAVLGIETHDKS